MRIENRIVVKVDIVVIWEEELSGRPLSDLEFVVGQSRDWDKLWSGFWVSR